MQFDIILINEINILEHQLIRSFLVDDWINVGIGIIKKISLKKKVKKKKRVWPSNAALRKK